MTSILELEARRTVSQLGDLGGCGHELRSDDPPKMRGLYENEQLRADYTDYEAILAVIEAGNQSGTLQPQAGRTHTDLRYTSGTPPRGLEQRLKSELRRYSVMSWQ
jgi:hypothetical protein